MLLARRKPARVACAPLCSRSLASLLSPSLPPSLFRVACTRERQREREGGGRGRERERERAERETERTETAVFISVQRILLNVRGATMRLLLTYWIICFVVTVGLTLQLKSIPSFRLLQVLNNAFILKILFFFTIKNSMYLYICSWRCSNSVRVILTQKSCFSLPSTGIWIFMFTFMFTRSACGEETVRNK